jgi:hypothetical protein
MYNNLEEIEKIVSEFDIFADIEADEFKFKKHISLDKDVARDIFKAGAKSEIARNFHTLNLAKTTWTNEEVYTVLEQIIEEVYTLYQDDVVSSDIKKVLCFEEFFNKRKK